MWIYPQTAGVAKVYIASKLVAGYNNMLLYSMVNVITHGSMVVSIVSLYVPILRLEYESI